MYTVEFESDASIITTLDDKDRFNDVEMVLADDGSVYLRQFDEELAEYQMLYMSYQQFLDLIAAHQSPEGAYRLELRAK
jgi:hypothetical protein